MKKNGIWGTFLYTYSLHDLCASSLSDIAEPFEKRYGIHSTDAKHMGFNFLGHEPVPCVYVFMFENNILSEDL